MDRLTNMIMRVAMWAGLGAVVGFVCVAVYQAALSGDAVSSAFSMDSAKSGGSVGALIGGVVGFFKKM